MTILEIIRSGDDNALISLVEELTWNPRINWAIGSYVLENDCVFVNDKNEIESCKWLRDGQCTLRLRYNLPSSKAKEELCPRYQQNKDKAYDLLMKWLTLEIES